MSGDRGETALDKWDVFKETSSREQENIKYFHSFQSFTGNEKYRSISAIFQNFNDEVFGIGHNNEDNLLALTGEDFGKSIVLKEPRKIGGLSNQKCRKIVVSERFGAAVTDDGRLLYWGVDMDSLQWEVKDKKYVKLPYEQREDVVDIACGAHFMTIVTSENVLLWGCINLYYSHFYKFERLLLRSEVKVKNLAAGWYHMAILDGKGQVWTCGYGSVGQLGYRSSGSDNTTPKKVPLPRPCIKVECGAYSTLFLLDNGDVYACGSNTPSDRLCVGKSGIVISPLKVLLDDSIQDIAASYAWASGQWQSLFSAVTKNQTKYFKWGLDSKSEKPTTAANAHSLLDIFINFKTPQSLGNLHSEISPTTPIFRPRQPKTTSLDKSVLQRWIIFDAPGDSFIENVRCFTVFEGTNFRKWIPGTFVVTANDDVYSWGYNGRVKLLGIGSNEEVTTKPTKVDNLCGKRIRKIVINILRGGIALSADGSMYVWNEKELPHIEPTLAGKSVVDVTWGTSFYVYQLENFEVYVKPLFTSSEDLKIAVPGNEKVVKLVSGERYFLVLTDESNVYSFAFGVGPYGTLGDEWEKYDNTIMRRLKLNSFGPCKNMMGGLRTSVCLTERGELFEIGYTYYLDFPAFKQERVEFKPKQIPMSEEVVDIASTYFVGANFACETASGKIYKWGEKEVPEEVAGAKYLVEAFEEKSTPLSLSMVKIDSTPNLTDEVYKPNEAVQNTLFSDPLYSDVNILLRDGAVYGHKAILHTRSAFFRRLLTAVSDANELDLVTYNPKAVRALLKRIYRLPIGKRAISTTDVLDFLKLAMEDGNSDSIKAADDAVVGSLILNRHLRAATTLGKTAKLPISTTFP